MEKTADEVQDIDGRVVVVGLVALAAPGEVSDEEGPGHREHRPDRKTPDSYTKNCMAAVPGQTGE